MSKTIRQIAEEIGVSKTTVMKQIENLGLRSSLRKNGNQFAIDEEQERRIKSAFQKNETQTETQTSLQIENQNISDLIAILKEQIDKKDAEIDKKDAEIERLNKAYEELNNKLTELAFKSLEIGIENQKNLELEDKAIEVVEKKKKNWFWGIRKSNKTDS